MPSVCWEANTYAGLGFVQSLAALLGCRLSSVPLGEHPVDHHRLALADDGDPEVTGLGRSADGSHGGQNPRLVAGGRDQRHRSVLTEYGLSDCSNQRGGGGHPRDQLRPPPSPLPTCRAHPLPAGPSPYLQDRPGTPPRIRRGGSRPDWRRRRGVPGAPPSRLLLSTGWWRWVAADDLCMHRRDRFPGWPSPSTCSPQTEARRPAHPDSPTASRSRVRLLQRVRAQPVAAVLRTCPLDALPLRRADYILLTLTPKSAPAAAEAAPRGRQISTIRDTVAAFHLRTGTRVTCLR